MSGDVFSSVEDIKMSLHLGEIGDDIPLEVAEMELTKIARVLLMKVAPPLTMMEMDLMP